MSPSSAPVPSSEGEPFSQTPELAALYEIGKVLSTTPDLSASLGQALGLLRESTGALSAALILQPAPGELQCQVSGAPDLALLGELPPGETWARALPGLEQPHQLLATIAVNHNPVGWLVCRFATAPDQEPTLLNLTATLIGQQLSYARQAAHGCRNLQERSRRVSRQIASWGQLEGLVGTSRAMQEVFSDILRIAPKAEPVLLEGEPGTGKAAVARAIHGLSPRQNGPFIVVDCHDMPEEVLERRLFGPRDGVGDGAWQQALGGSLFLDGIGEMGLTVQTRILALLQAQESPNPAPRDDLRLIVATHRNLEGLVVSGRFRADLYYRIHGEAIQLPALRERREDIPALVEQFLHRYGQTHRRALRLEGQALGALYRCQWPGNVAGLESCLEQAAAQAQGDTIRALPCGTRHCQAAARRPPSYNQEALAASAPEDQPYAAPLAPEASPDTSGTPAPTEAPAAKNGDIIDRQSVLWALEKCGWVQAKAARLLHISARQMWYAVHKYGIQLKKL